MSMLAGDDVNADHAAVVVDVAVALRGVERPGDTLVRLDGEELGQEQLPATFA